MQITNCWKKFSMAVAVGLFVAVPAHADSEGNIDAQVLYRTVQFSPISPAGFSLTPPRQGVPQLAANPLSLTDATWVGLGTDTSWFTSANWSTNLVPDAAGAVARFTSVSGGPVVTLGGSAITLDTLEMSDPLLSAIVGGTINLSGSATVLANGSNLDLPSTLFTFPSADPIAGIGFNNIGGSGSLASSFGGSSGLNKTGDTHIQIDSPQLYTGTTTISGGKIISTVGDAAFGNSANSIGLNGGSIQISTANWTTSRNINVGAAGGSIYWNGAGRTFDSSGDISGSGTLTLNGVFGSASAATIHSANSFTGALNVGGGTVIVGDTAGAFANVASIRNQGTIILDNSAASGSVDRLNNSAQITMRGAALTVKGGASDYSETLGALNLDGAVSFITVTPGTGAAQVTFGNLSRNSNNGGVVFRGASLGNAPGAGNANVFLANGASLLSKGIIPFAYANPTFNPATSVPETLDNTLVTYGANGVTPITLYNPDFTSSTNDTNVRITANQTLSSTVNTNALVIAAPANLVQPTGAAGITLGGAGIIHIDSGVLLNANAGFSGTATNINSLPGNVINANLDFGAAPIVIMSPSALTINGAINGTGGLTKIGARTVKFTGGNVYTGTTVLNGFTRFSGNVFADGFTPTPFGLDTSPIILYGGNVSPFNPVEGAFDGTGRSELGADQGTASVSFNRALDIRGDNVFLRDFGTGSVTWAGNITVTDPATNLSFVTSTAGGHMRVTGSISGAGHVAASSSTWVDLLTANTFTGGFELNGGTVGIGNNSALGNGVVQVDADSSISALTAARNVSNKFVMYSGILTIAGSNPMTLSGEINGRGGDYVVNVTNTASTTFAGVMTAGGLYKTGSGTLFISNSSNSFQGTLNVGNGTTAGGMIVLTASGATGSTIGATAVNYGNNAIGLSGAAAAGGGITIGAESLYLRGDGISSQGSLQNLDGNNVWGGLIQTVATYNADTTVLSQSATVNVSTSSTLTANAGFLGVDPGVFDPNANTTVFNANSIGLHKRGAGLLLVGSSVLNTTVGPTNFNYNGAIASSGSLDIQAGTIQIKPGSGDGSIAGGKSVVDVGGINIAGGPAAPTAKLDLSSNGMVVRYSSTGISPIQDIRQYIKAGSASNWTGNGITSSAASASPGTALGYAEAAALAKTSFLNDPVTNQTVLIKYTWAGDANLDGQVDVTDLGALATHWQTTALWTGGDFNYDNFVDVTDLGLLATNWQKGVSNPLGAGSLQVALAALGLGNSVPEPSLMGLIACALISLWGRSRKRAA